MKVGFRVFRSDDFPETQTQVEPTARRVAEFAGSLEPGRLVSVSHVVDGRVHIFTVWYWKADLVG